MTRILYPTADGGVAVLIPAPEYLETHTIEELVAKDVPRDVAYQIVDSADIPSDRTFRNAWTIQDGAIAHDMEKCINITKNRLRAERHPLLAAQDILFQRALETGADTSAIITEKQRLRDVPELVTPEMTLDELKGLHA